MESSGSCSASAALTFPANTSLSLGMAIRDEENKLGHKKAPEMLVEGAFKCKLCPRAFKTAWARGGHQNAHRQRAPVKKQKAHKVGRQAWSPAGISPSSYATVLRSACLRAQPFSDWRSHYDPSVPPMPPSFPWQTGTGGGVAPAQLSAPAAGLRGTQDGINLGRQDGVREENQDETTNNGVDLSLKL